MEVLDHAGPDMDLLGDALDDGPLHLLDEILGVMNNVLPGLATAMIDNPNDPEYYFAYFRADEFHDEVMYQLMDFDFGGRGYRMLQH